MDPVTFDYYSDSSAPRTPSPRSSVSSEGVPSLEDMHPYQHSPAAYKPSFDLDPLRNILADQARDDPMAAYHPAHVVYAGNRGSLLQELYEQGIPEDAPHPHHDIYLPAAQSAEPYHGNEWARMSPASHLDHHQTLPPMRSPHDYGMVRRNTFPYARQERPDHYPEQVQFQEHGPMLGQPMYGEPMSLHGSPHMPLTAEPAEMYLAGGMHPSPHASYREFCDDGAVKLEEPSQVIVPSQAAPSAFYRPPSQQGQVVGMHPHHMAHAHSLPVPPPPLSYLSPHTGLPVQHTDDAASKETQYLRRRCFNCHTTEPPSWRRSTLNPGKIVCNKCGLYERTHLRPRPLRFDELRAGNKARKGSKGGAAAAAAQQNGTAPTSPKRAVVKKEPREYNVGVPAPAAEGGAMAISRRSSISSASSASGTSDWDDSGTSSPALVAVC
ncbi:hypothetical protein PUNSTDRAFT_51546 [Punctularia strigosozonata HHB-11173 SS5]|uniref:uncharacterized protein n=1 Tax=Punctularia strigosozonata (strain HHB-11173) TaxID=741275 RepID=UPI0004417767|nr:uncharacterized protein PUNSTDRAFT_51546 [Punctularia strigosozonata HHB-11173 SS5]EIN10981.1 hypothetical protein PUNSTDRAFT_51546 [Punctularia strigosozonata HHB-11173 SS5]